MERRWRDEAFAAMIPPSSQGRHPGLGAVDLESFWDRLGEVAPPLLRFGFRVAVWFVTFAPLLTLVGWRRLGRQPRQKQDRVLGALARSGSMISRQMVTTLKVLACLAYFGDEAVRRAVGGDAAARRLLFEGDARVGGTSEVSEPTASLGKGEA